MNNPINILNVEGDQIKPISSTFAKIGGQPHSKGGTLVGVEGTGEIVEAQRNEPVSTQSDGKVVAWGKLKNPHTGNTFEKDANILADWENAITKINTKADTLSQSAQPLSQSTSSVLRDAALKRDIDITMTKEIYAQTQQDILDVSEIVGKNPNEITKGMTKAKNGKTLNDPLSLRVKVTKVPKAADGKTLSKYKQYDERLQPILEQNLEYLDMGNIQPRDTLYGQRTNPNNTFGQAYADQLKRINLVQGTWGKTPYNWDTPENVGTFQSDYNTAFSTRLGQNFFEGTTDPTGVDKKAGNLTSSTPTFKSSFGGLQNKTLTIEEISKMSDDEFKAVSGYTKEQFSRLNPNLTAVTEYTFDPSLQLTPISQTGGVEVTPTQTYVTAPTTDVKPVTQSTTPESITPLRDTSSLADTNRFNYMTALPEIAMMLDRPDYVQRSEYRPQYQQDYQVTFQDRINQSQADFNRAQLAMQDNPLALASLMAEKRRADSQTLGEEFRTNQSISSGIANQNIQTYNQAEDYNMKLMDQQYMRQEQARTNTEKARMAGATSLSNKIRQNKAENNAIRLFESMSGFRGDEKMQSYNTNAPQTFMTADGKLIQATPEEIAKYNEEIVTRNRNKTKFNNLFRKNKK